MWWGAVEVGGLYSLKKKTTHVMLYSSYHQEAHSINKETEAQRRGTPFPKATSLLSGEAC